MESAFATSPKLNLNNKTARYDVWAKSRRFGWEKIGDDLPWQQARSRADAYQAGADGKFHTRITQVGTGPDSWHVNEVSTGA